MRNFISFVFLAVFSVAIMASCQTKETTTNTVVKTTVKEIGSEGFTLKKVVKDDTVWGYSQESYGTGIQWREIVKENPFLNEEGRIYYDQGREKWIVLIYPGETVKIKGQVLSPTFISEESTTTVTSETIGIPWWGWLIIAVGSVIILFLIVGTTGLLSYHRQYRPCYPPSNYFCEPPYLGRPASMDYESCPDGSFLLTSRGFGETTLNRDANGKTSLSVRR
jgi:hypothetical protein